MLVAIEGPDRAGKTTLFQELRKLVGAVRSDIVFVPALPMEASLLANMAAVERRTEYLWRQLYDPGLTYICDRHVSISAWVYDRLYGREQLDVSYWYSKVRMLYVYTSTDIMRGRPDELFDAKRYDAVIGLYRQAMDVFESVCIHGEEPERVLQAMRAITKWQG
jgi:hypothetical protein